MHHPAWQPKGRSTVSPFLTVRDAHKVLEFAKSIFGAEEITPPLWFEDGKLWNAEIAIGDSSIMIAEAPPGDEMIMPGWIYLYVEDVDAMVAKALDAGAQSFMPVEDQFYGDRAGGVKDMAGNIWWIATHEETLTHKEIVERARKVEEERKGK